MRTAISKPDVDIYISISSEWTHEPTRAIDLILRRSSKLSPACSKYLSLRAVLSENPPPPPPRWPKSMREALKSSESSVIVCTALDESSEEVETEQAFLQLKAVYLTPARRLTRAVESWKLQLKTTGKGHALLVAAEMKGLTIGASYFLRCGKSSPYGVSASHLEYRTLSIGHVIMVEAIDFARRNALDTFWVGSQFSHNTRDASKKEFQIGNFKSYFARNLSLRI